MESESKVHKIYAILLEGTACVHVHHATDTQTSRFYKRIESGKISAAADMVDRAKKAGGQVSLYLLEESACEGEVDAYHRCIAWEMLFSREGFVPQSERDRRHIAHPNESELQHYAAIRGRDLNVLCKAERDLVPQILAARRGPRDENAPFCVRLSVPPEAHALLVARARSHGEKLPAYILACAMAEPVGPDLSVVVTYHREVSRYLSLLRGYVAKAALAGSLPSAERDELREACRCISDGLQAVARRLAELAAAS